MENLTDYKHVIIKDTTANPAPLGLLGFGVTTVLLNIHNAGFIALDSMILSMGLAFGGISQIIAGIMEWKKNNTFGTTAFTSYGLFWISLVVIILFPQKNLSTKPGDREMAAYLFMWGLFTLCMFVGTFRLNIALQFVFGSLTILFFLLALGDLTKSQMLKTIAGYEGIFCGFTAIYTGIAQVLNEIYKKIVLPIYPVKT
jgi:uncharacterized protein